MEQGFKTLVYAVKHKDFETRMASRSGGIFTALSDCVLKKSGVVYGCVLTEDFNDNKGVSLVLVNSELGFEFFEQVKDFIDYRESSIENSMQPALIKPTDKPSNREDFWNNYNKRSFNYIAKKYGSSSMAVKIKRKFKKIINK